jgi:uncharacterized protein YwqG
VGLESDVSESFLGKFLKSLGLSPRASEAVPQLTRHKLAPEPPQPAPEPSPRQGEIDAAIARYRLWLEDSALPAVLLDTTAPAAPTPGGSRVGGPAWLPEGEVWPTGADGARLAFLAQLDLAELPALPDFPTHGVLQFFIGTCDVYGCDFDRPEAGDFRVFWREATDTPGALHPNIEGSTSPDGPYSPLDGAVLETGLALRGEFATHRPDISAWFLDRDLPGLMQDTDLADAIYDFVDSTSEEQPLEMHHMGGHPGFTQSDYRAVDGYQDVDRVLLNLWSQPGNEQGGWSILWGDVGQGQFTIRRADLLARRFDKALYQWDCG